MNSNILAEASKESDEFEDELTCVICLDLLYQPVSIQCGHTFCKKCLNEYVNIPL